jgi:CPA1 family monovalent cation:H+ antiporter
MEALAVWEVGLFVLNGLVFVLIGLQLPLILQGLAGQPAVQLLGYGLAISLAVIVLRFVWVFPATYLPRLLSRRIRSRDPYPGWRIVVVVAWTGMRGVVSLAAALSLPLTTATGAPFPGRDLLLLVTFCVILVTLVGQGLTLPALMRRLGLAAADPSTDEELTARRQAIEAALARFDELAAGDEAAEGSRPFVQTYYGKRRKQADTRLGQVSHEHGPEDGLHHDHEPGRDHTEDHRDRLTAFTRLRLELLRAERVAIVRLRDAEAIGDEVMQRIERDLDLEELRLAGD